jgi:hypothetical protein
MAEFAPFDLGKVFATAQAIKGMRQDAENDKLRNAYLNTQMAGAQQQQQFAQQNQTAEMDARTARGHYLANQAIVAADDPIAAAKQLAPESIQAFEAAHGPGSFDQLTPDQVRKLASFASEKAAAAAGINLRPSPDVQAQQTFAREMDTTNFGQQKELAGLQHKYRLGEIGATNAAKPGRSFRALTPDELAQVGLPAGTSAQLDETTGKIDVISKRDNTNTLSQKDATTAKMKLNTVSLARQQLNRIREEFEGKVDPKTGQRAGGIKGTMSAGAFGQGKIPTEGGRKFDAAVNQMRSTLTALTRVPGVGAMSDYETKLDQSKFPTRNDYESVTEQQLGDLDNMLNAIETGYKDLLSGGQQQGAAPGQQSGPAQIKSDADYAQLPSGAQYIAPDGSTRTKR